MPEPLKPCPFCGGAASDYPWVAGCWEVECKNCHGSLPGHSRAEARAAWNRRAPVAQPAITRTDDTLSGEWRIAGTRIATRTIYRAHKDGLEAEQIVAAWHGITAEDVRLAIEFEGLRTFGASLRRAPAALPTREEVIDVLAQHIYAGDTGAAADAILALMKGEG